MNIYELDVVDGSGYLIRQYQISEEKSFKTECDLERELLDEIISLEVGLYVLRGTAGGTGFTIDNVYATRRRLINLYEEITGLEYKYYNEELL